MILLTALLTLASCTITDGDTIKCGSERIRLVGYDAPELFSPKCASEKALATQSRDRLRELLEPGFVIERTGRDFYGRTLATVTVRGVNVGDRLIAEGLARPYAGGRKPWCP